MRLIARTKHIQHLEVVNYHLSEAIDKLLHKDLTNPSVVKKNATHVRGHHYPGLMGPWRQSMKVSTSLFSIIIIFSFSSSFLP